MPASGEPLTAAQIATLRAWIDAGAVWPETAAAYLRAGSRPSRPASPSLPEGSEPHPIDRFIAAYFAKHAIAFPAAASDARFARRVYFDLWGLPPTPAQLDTFLHDPSPDKRARLIDALLADSRPYAEHWISWWNDLLRNDLGGELRGRTQVHHRLAAARARTEPAL